MSAAPEDTIAEDMFGFYAEAAYDVLPLVLPETTQYLAPFFRYEIFDTQDDVPDGLRARARQRRAALHRRLLATSRIRRWC